MTNTPAWGLRTALTFRLAHEVMECDATR
jgi:hypothetical protein